MKHRDHDPADLQTLMARRFRRRIVIVVLACAFAFTWLGWIVHDLGNRGDREQQRADQASQAATQACDQLLQLGYPCPFDPAQFRGETGATGPAGRAPTEAEIAAAVSVYLARSAERRVRKECRSRW